METIRDVLFDAVLFLHFLVNPALLCGAIVYFGRERKKPPGTLVAFGTFVVVSWISFGVLWGVNKYYFQPKMQSSAVMPELAAVNFDNFLAFIKIALFAIIAFTLTAFGLYCIAWIHEFRTRSKRTKQ